jgi:hypothetical protein
MDTTTVSVYIYTWVQTARYLRSIIDYEIVRQVKGLIIRDVRVYRGMSCGSYHFLLKAKIMMPFISRNKADDQTLGQS